MTHFTEYSIASGWDAVDDLEPIGEILPMGSITFPEPAGAQSRFAPGIIKQRLDNQLVVVGFNRQEWLLWGLVYKQYRYLQDTYCSGGFSGKLTVRTRWQEQS